MSLTMFWFQGTAKFAAVCIMLDVLMLHVLAQDRDSPKGEQPCHSVFSCYACRTNAGQQDPYCGDPFNTSHPSLKVTPCENLCAKWVVQLQNGDMQTTRTCSDHLELNLRIYAVCMRESASTTGHLCFCEGELCNGATPLTSKLWTYIICVLIASVFTGFHHMVFLE